MILISRDALCDDFLILQFPCKIVEIRIFEFSMILYPVSFLPQVFKKGQKELHFSIRDMCRLILLFGENIRLYSRGAIHENLGRESSCKCVNVVVKVVSNGIMFWDDLIF